MTPDLEATMAILTVNDTTITAMVLADIVGKCDAHEEHPALAAHRRLVARLRAVEQAYRTAAEHDAMLRQPEPASAQPALRHEISRETELELE